MYQVFNMGQRLEIYTPPAAAADDLIKLIQSFGMEARIIGRVEPSSKKELLIDTGKNQIGY